MDETEIGPTVTAVIKESSRITDETTAEVRQIILHINEPSFRYTVGQSIGVVIPGPHEFGNKFHMRRYSIADGRSDTADEGIDLTIVVRRCFYVDEVNGEKYPGIASNYLCDARPGDTIVVSGPYRSPFTMPADNTANLLLIGTGTGIAPFRAFIKQIYRSQGGWKGKVRLFYGAKTGLDLLYMNDKNDDLANYYDEDTFRAYNALTDRPMSGDERALEHSLQDNIKEAWELMQQPNTYVFLAGLHNAKEALDKVMSNAAGSESAWFELEQKMVDENRWSKLLYS